ncbi:hypothetical protein Tco_0542393 [Tanacetum coccineum]
MSRMERQGEGTGSGEKKQEGTPLPLNEKEGCKDAVPWEIPPSPKMISCNSRTKFDFLLFVRLLKMIVNYPMAVLVSFGAREGEKLRSEDKLSMRGEGKKKKAFDTFFKKASSCHSSRPTGGGHYNFGANYTVPR